MVVAAVKIWDFLVGAVSWDNERKHSYFEFEPSFFKAKLDLAPISMPIIEAARMKKIYSFPRLSYETYKGLPGLLADSLPDNFGNQIINAWLASQGKSVDNFSPIERLCYVGERGMGALEFQPSNSPKTKESSPIQIEELRKLASDILNKQSKFTSILTSDEETLKDIVKVGTSAGGARAKAILAFNEKTGEVRSGQIQNSKDFTYWILKFDGIKDKELKDPEGYGRIEYAYYLMALDCGIEMMESKLLEEHDRAHFMTKRFDRINGNEKLHMQTLCAIAHFDYNKADFYSYEQVFQVMRQLRLSYQEAEEMYRRMVFNIIARNQDDHTKNISFLMNKDGEWKLSPAYDLTYSYNPESYWTKQHQLSISGKRDLFNKNDLLEIGKKMNIKNRNAILEQVTDIVSDWMKYANKANIERKTSNAIAITHRIKI
jgi:serine/threonine-protein kinase HipA